MFLRSHGREKTISTGRWFLRLSPSGLIGFAEGIIPLFGYDELKLAKRRITMKSLWFVFFVLLTESAFAQQSAPEIAFDSVPDFPKLPPGVNFGEVPGVAVNSKGHVFVFTRSNSASG